MTAIVRGKLKDGQFVEQQTVYKAPAELYRTGGNHFGSRLVFDKGYLFFSIGERGQQDDAQDVTRPNGKVHRIFDDGRVPDDNPFVGQAGALATIWSYGHRNPQGLAQGPVHRAALRRRARPARRRRAEPRAEGPQLRLAGHHLRHELRRHADDGPDGQGGHGAAGDLLGALDCGLVDRLLQGHEVPEVGRPVVPRRAGAGGTAPPGRSPTARSRTRRCCSRASAACATSSAARTGSST